MSSILDQIKPDTAETIAAEARARGLSVDEYLKSLLPQPNGIDLRQTSTMKTQRGDVVLVLFPNSDLRTAKRRPALILQRDNLGSGLSQTIIAMISSNLARRGHPSRLFIGVASAEGRAAGLRLDSVVMTDNLATVLDSEIDSALGRMADLAAVDVALSYTLGLS